MSDEPEYVAPETIQEAGRRILGYALGESRNGASAETILLGIIAEVGVWTQTPISRAKKDPKTIYLSREGVA